MKKKMSSFYKIYFSLIAIFFVCLIGFSIYLYMFVNDYNKGLSETVSKEFFQSTFKEYDIDKIIEMSGEVPNEFEDDATIKSYYESLLQGDLSFTSVTSIGSDDDKKYVVKSAETPIAAFTLSLDENDDYKVKSLEMIDKRRAVTVKILNSSTLYINGKPVGESYIIEKEAHKYAQFLPENVSAPEWVTYNIPEFTKDAEISVTDRNGQNPVLVDTDGVLTEEIVYDDRDDAIFDRILTASKEYAKCMQNDGSKYTAFKYYEKGTELYEWIRTSETTFVWDHYGYDFEDVSLSEFFRYDENTISLRVSFTHVLKRHGRENYIDMVDITYFARNIDGEYYIFAQHNNV